MDALSWIGQIAQTLGSLIPTWHHIEWCDVCVAITRGKHLKSIQPGIIWYWPFWTTIYHRIAARQTKDLKTQTLMTKDNIVVAIGCMVRYKIPRPWVEGEENLIEDADIKALIDTHDIDNSVIDETLAVLCVYITEKTLTEINHDRALVNQEITEIVRERMATYGVYVERAQLTDLAQGTPLIHIGAMHTKPNDPEHQSM